MKSRILTLLTAMTLSAALMGVLLGRAEFALASTDFVVSPGRTSSPYSIVVGPDKNLWFTEIGGEKIGRITTSGVIKQFPIPKAQSLIGIASGPDGNLWFTDQLTGKVGHISTAGKDIKQFELPKGSFPQGITAGPDGNLWFVDQKQNGLFEIGKITVSGTITEYPTNVNVGTFQADPAVGGNYGSITAGPDGNLWFVNSQNLAIEEIGKITTGGTITFYPTKDFPYSITAGPDGSLWAIESAHVANLTSGTEYSITSGGGTGITTGPDGNIWFTESNSSFGNVTPAGVVTEYPSQFPAFYILASLTSGPDGALWITGDLTSNIARVTTNGQLTNTYPLSTGSWTGFDALGPDGNVWFTELIPSYVGNVTPGGVITTYPTPSPDAFPSAITAGADGNLWFIEEVPGQVAKVTPSGTVTEYPLANADAEVGLTAGPDGNVWYTVPFSFQGPSIARITPAGVITLFALPNSSAVPLFITSGPDGNLWFTDDANSEVGKMNTSGSGVVEYPTTTSNANPSVITAGPDGNLWFIENTAFGAVAKITTSGTVTEYPAQVQNFQDGIMAAADGAIWFAQCYPNSIARISTSGVLSTVALTTPNACGNSLTVAADGRLWVAEGYAGALSRLSAIGGTGETIEPKHGQPFKGTVAVFEDGTPAATESELTAKIYWGDGKKSDGTVTGAMGGPFSVSGTHTYAKSGTYTLTITLTDSVDKATYTASPGEAEVN